jgi:hypothetical protein
VDRSYVYTFVSRYGEEGPPSDPSSLVAVDPTQDANVTNMDTAVVGNYDITQKRIYRTVTSDAGTFFQLVDTINLATATYLDTKADSDVTTILPSEGWVAPRPSVHGIVAMPGGFIAGFSGNTVYFSEPYYPHAWPLRYALTVDYTIVGLGVNSAGLVVLTRGSPYLMVGESPATMSVVRIESEQACVSKRSIRVAGDEPNTAVIYASPDGLVIVEGAAARLFTEGFWRKEQWKLLTPTSMISAVHDGRYFAFLQNTAFILDFSKQGSIVTTTTVQVQGLYVDLLTDTLNIIIKGTNDLKSWRTGTNNLTIRWKSKEMVFPRRYSYNTARVLAESYASDNVKLRLFADGTQVKELTVADDVAFRVPKLRDEKVWAFEVEATEEVYEALLSTSMSEL